MLRLAASEKPPSIWSNEHGEFVGVLTAVFTEARKLSLCVYVCVCSERAARGIRLDSILPAAPLRGQVLLQERAHLLARDSLDRCRHGGERVRDLAGQLVRAAASTP